MTQKFIEGKAWSAFVPTQPWRLVLNKFDKILIKTYNISC